MKKITKWHILTIGLLLFVMSGVFLWWGICNVSTLFDKILVLVAVILSVLISSVFFIIFAISCGKSHNVFLYDKKTKREIKIEDLTFERICEFLDLYIGLIFNDRKRLLFTDLFNSDLLKKAPKIYHSLIQLRLLSIWMEIDTGDNWNLFAEIDKNYINTMEDVLFNCGEYQISSRLQYLWSSYSGDDTEIKNFFLNNIEYLKEFILSYVKTNIHSFD